MRPDWGRIKELLLVPILRAFLLNVDRLEDNGDTDVGTCRVKEVRRNVGRWERRHGYWNMEWTRGRGVTGDVGEGREYED